MAQCVDTTQAICTTILKGQFTPGECKASPNLPPGAPSPPEIQEGDVLKLIHKVNEVNASLTHPALVASCEIPFPSGTKCGNTTKGACDAVGGVFNDRYLCRISVVAAADGTAGQETSTDGGEPAAYGGKTQSSY
jgi:hypothetical protein